MAEAALYSQITETDGVAGVALETAARVLRRGALLHALLAGLMLIFALLASTRLVPSLYDLAQQLFLLSYGGASDAALAIVIIFSLVNISALLVIMVSVLAREIWALPGLLVLALANAAVLLVLGYTPALITVIVGAWALVRLLRAPNVLRVNPVMMRELRGRMRGARAFVVMSIYLALMSGFALLLYVIFSTASSLNASAATGQIGRVLFAGVVGIELLLIIFIAPSFTSGAITGERERQTYDLLRTTLLATPSFITGKLESSLGYVLLLLFAAIPLQSLAFLFGGVTETEVILAFLILTITAVTFGTFGIYFSATQPRTLAASVRTYGTIAAWAFIIPLVIGFIVNIIQAGVFGNANAPNAPGLEALLQYVNLLLTSTNPFATAIQTQRLLVEQQVIGLYSVTLASDGSTIPMISPWVVFATLYQAIAAILIVLTIRRTQQVDVNS
ncbi:MAG: hypothetical protein IT320_25525 [Anaerolineae bacterium]|nr:hypothetical protein [Anaerolineae bacterium]